MSTMNTGTPQKKQNTLAHQPNTQNHQQTHGDVWQDNSGFSTARSRLRQPAPLANDMRARTKTAKTTRSKNSNEQKRQTVQLTLWVKPRVKEKLLAIAQSHRVTMSKAGASFLERSLQQQIDMQYGALLVPTIEQAIQRAMQGISNRFAWILIRLAFASEQTRILVFNLLAKQPGMTGDTLSAIREKSKTTAIKNIVRRTPELIELMKEMQTWLEAAEEVRKKQ